MNNDKNAKNIKTAGNRIETDVNIVAEKFEIFEEYTIFLIPYTDRKDLTAAEKVCIGNYQDVHFWNEQKKDWSFDLPKDWKTKPWCYALNSCCRDESFQKALSGDERILIESNIRNIDSAIEKSKSDKNYIIYRGVKDTDWLKEKYVGGTFTEKAFGSFTLDLNKALEYSNFENPTVLLFEIKKGMNVLYMDKNEREMLLPRDLTYEIKKIENVYLEEERIEYIAYNIIFKREENESHAVRIV